MKKVQKPEDELKKLQDRETPRFTKAILEYADAMLSKSSRGLDDAERKLQELIASTLFLSDLLGRRRLLLEADAVKDRPQPGNPGIYSFAEKEPKLYVAPVIPRVGFESAAKDLLAREPRLKAKAESIWELYRKRKAFVLGKKTTREITAKVRDTIAQALREGETEITTGKVIARMGGWSEAYGRTVYRTNLATAYTGGRFAEARDPDVAKVIGAFQFDAIRDNVVRPNHKAADGIIAAVNDPIWNYLSPPLGFNCRCSLRMVDRFELQRKGLLKGGVIQRSPKRIPFKAQPDKGFSPMRADRKLYG